LLARKLGSTDTSYCGRVLHPTQAGVRQYTNTWFYSIICFSSIYYYCRRLTV